MRERMAEAGTQTFREALGWVDGEAGVAHLRLTPDWGQGRATHGGLVGAIALRQMQRLASAERPVRSLTVTFVGPLLAGEAICRTQLLRAGKSSTLIEARIEQGKELCCVAQGVFAGARSSIVSVDMRAAPALEAPAVYAALPYIDGAMPAMLQHVRMHWAFGNYPWSGTEITPLRGYCELIDDERPDACSITALLDAWPTPAHAPMTAPSGASTVSWSIDFIADMAAPTHRAPFLFEGSIAAASSGHAQGDAWLWDTAGAPLARARQLVALFG